MNTESFIARSKQINGNQYGYEQAVFVNWKTPIVIICKIHGAFKQWPETHFNGAGCRRCKGIKAMAVKVIESANNFITRARKAHGEKYNYSKTIYIASHQKVVIICPNHGDFEQVASSHLLGSGCRLCAQELQKNINKKKFKKLTCEFIENARSIHGNKYDYKDVLYLNYNTPVKIICSFHGLFMQSPGIHLKGGGCKRCADIKKGESKRKKAAKEFSSRANDLHGSKYDYSKAKYVGSSVKLEIICKKHGSFLIRPNCLLRGQGCSKCGTESMVEKQSTGKNKFIEQAIAVHCNKYDYSQTIYVSTHRHVTIICLQHGFFSQAPSGHISGRGCPKCGIEKCAKNNMDSLEVFIEKAKMIHGEKYDYSKAIYKGSSTSLTIICTLHGPFLQRPDKHCGAGHGCPTCVNRDMDTEKFILRAQEVHRGKYNYKQSIYTIAKAKITIICPEHGLFEQVAWNHMAGIGCPLCVDQLNSRGVKRIEAWLGKNSISFVREKTFPDLRSHKRGNKHLRFDFFLTDLNVLIEFDGEQHFKPNKFWGGDESFNNLKSNDQRKNSWAIENGYNLLRINFNDKENIESMLSDYLCNCCKFNTGYNVLDSETFTKTMNNKGKRKMTLIEILPIINQLENSKVKLGETLGAVVTAEILMRLLGEISEDVKNELSVPKENKKQGNLKQSKVESIIECKLSVLEAALINVLNLDAEKIKYFRKARNKLAHGDFGSLTEILGIKEAGMEIDHFGKRKNLDRSNMKECIIRIADTGALEETRRLADEVSEIIKKCIIFNTDK